MLKSLFSHLNGVIESYTGFRLQPSAEYRLEKSRTKILSQTDVSFIVDVGANRGQWATRVFNSGFTGKVISFEPTSFFQELKRNASSTENWEVRNKALGSRAGKMDMYISSNEGLSSSLLPPSGIRARRPDISFDLSEMVEVETLDHELKNNDEKFYLKIDTQGSEMNVLIGGEVAIEKCIAIEFESALSSLYQGEHLHYNISTWLIDRGFEPIQLVVTDWDIQLRTVSLDSIFIRKKS